jgi:hypothetical protein
MKRKIINMYILLVLAFGYATAQDVITVTANDHEISDNLDLQAVASIFGDSEDLEDFENRLNDPDTRISNLDLNRDGYVDYLRVVELSENNTHLIAIQAVIGSDLYQDVATIEVEQDKHGVTIVQVVGDVYMYGPDYIIEPVYVHRPLIVIWFWGPYYRPWYSPYYWGCYPHFYRPWRPYHPYIYRTNVHVHINAHHIYHYTNVRRSMTAMNMYHRIQRNDYGNRHPENSFVKRNKGISNRGQLNRQRTVIAANNNKHAKPARTVDSKAQRDWKATPERNDRKKDSWKNSPAPHRKDEQQKINRTRKTSPTVYKQPAQKRQVSNKQKEQSKMSVKHKNNRTTKKPAETFGNQSTKKQHYAKKPTSRNTERANQVRKTTAKTAKSKSHDVGKQTQKTNKGKINSKRN